jgi:hypothetical protein
VETEKPAKDKYEIYLIKRDYEASMFSAVFTLACFFGLLRIGKFTANTYKNESGRLLQIKDIRLFATPPRIQMTIRKSKTDQNGKTFTLVINSAKAQLICPVRPICTIAI